MKQLYLRSKLPWFLYHGSSVSWIDSHDDRKTKPKIYWILDWLVSRYKYPALHPVYAGPAYRISFPSRIREGNDIILIVSFVFVLIFTYMAVIFRLCGMWTSATNPYTPIEVYCSTRPETTTPLSPSRTPLVSFTSIKFFLALPNIPKWNNM